VPSWPISSVATSKCGLLISTISVINFHDPNRTLTDKRYFTGDNFEQVKNLQIQSFLEQWQIDGYFGGQDNDNKELIVFVQEVPGDFHVRPLSVPFESRTLHLFLSDQQTIHPGLVHHLMCANMPGGSLTLDKLKAQLGQCASEQEQGFDFLSGKCSEGTPALVIALQENNIEAVKAFGKLFDFAAEKGLITDDQPFKLLSAECEGTPALFIALSENNAEAARVFCNLVICAAEKKLITKEDLFKLLSAERKGTPALFVVLQENNAEAARAFCDFVICAAEKNLITKEDLFKLLSAERKGTPALFMALKENNAEAARAFCDFVICAAEKKLITKEDLFKLLSAEDEGTPALFIALQENNDEAARVFRKAVASAAEKNLITDDEASRRGTDSYNIMH
jgi:hypothetical protein